MARFRFKAVSTAGDVIEGETEAVSRTAVVERLRNEGYVPIQAEESVGPAPRGIRFRMSLRRRRITSSDIAMLTRELAMLLHAGLPVDRALTLIGNNLPPGSLRDMVEKILDRVRGGVTLADALDDHAAVLPSYYTGMIRAGEAGGTLVEVLERLADALERAIRLKENVRSALQYPMIVVIMAVISVAILMAVVIPEFQPLFDEAGAALPLSTRIMIAIADFVRAFWWAIGGAIIVVTLILRHYWATPRGRLGRDGMLLRLPLIGDLVRKVEIARLCRTLGTLLSNGVSVLAAVSMTGAAIENRAIAEVMVRVRSRLEKGEGLAGPLEDTGAFPPLAMQLIKVGEEASELEAMLLRVADIYDDEVKRSIDRLLALLVPLVTIALGILVGTIIGSLMAAILSVYDLPF